MCIRFSIKTIFIKHLKNWKHLKEKLWRWIATKPESITMFNYYCRLRKLFSINRKTKHWETLGNFSFLSFFTLLYEFWLRTVTLLLCDPVLLRIVSCYCNSIDFQFFDFFSDITNRTIIQLKIHFFEHLYNLYLDTVKSF